MNEVNELITKISSFTRSSRRPIEAYVADVFGQPTYAEGGREFGARVVSQTRE